ncbi:hypothetical protein [Leptothermofonsia sp. ETS-13]|uniref:hypothetical protein n=1 Tax=Leptothermofonsia sp. ETS-13 TaxID=3035696 RepID=UPI003BA36B24
MAKNGLQQQIALYKEAVSTYRYGNEGLRLSAIDVHSFIAAARLLRTLTLRGWGAAPPARDFTPAPRPKPGGYRYKVFGDRR